MHQPVETSGICFIIDCIVLAMINELVVENLPVFFFYRGMKIICTACTVPRVRVMEVI